MKETTGTLNLKIERLRQQLSVLQQQQELGRTYPDFLIVLQRKFMEIERDRRQLVQMREELGGYAVQNTEQGIINGEQRYGTESVYAVD